MNYEGNGDSVTVATDDNNNNNENHTARENSPMKSLGSEDSKSRVCTLDLYTVPCSIQLLFPLCCVTVCYESYLG